MVQILPLQVRDQGVSLSFQEKQFRKAIPMALRSMWKRVTFFEDQCELMEKLKIMENECAI